MLPLDLDATNEAACILERISDAFFSFDADWRFTYVNNQAEQLLLRPRQKLLGGVVWDLFPDAVGTAFEQQYHQAMTTQEAVTFEEYYPPPLDAWFEVKAYPSSDGLSVFFQNVSARRRGAEALRESEERLRLLVEGAKDYAMILLDAEGRITGWNAGAERILGWAEGEVLGQPADLIFTHEDRAQGIPAQEMGIARAEGRALDLRWHLRKDGSRFFADGILEGLRDGAGQPRGFAKILRDATVRAERERRERFLSDLAERARLLTDPEAVIADALRSVGEFLGVARCVFVDIDVEADLCTCHPDYRADPSVVSMEGVSPISSFGDVVVREYGAGHAVRVDDVHLDHAQVPPDSIVAYDALSIRAHIGVPVVHSSRLVSCIGAHSAVPRHWTPEEVELLRTVVERTWLTVEVTRQERALVREAEAAARVLESITDAFFALDHQWRFTHVNGETERVLSFPREQLLGRYIWEVFPEGEGSFFDLSYRRAVAEGVSLSFEEYFAPLDIWFEVKAFPSPDGLSVFFQNINERKALQAERERLVERERNIAEQLQAALTPAVPKQVSGMSLAHYYEAALDESGVGGDFYDVFAMDKGCTALLVGDLAGKGLAAASQVATVRNMLRYALHRAQTLVGALDGLNALLAEQSLLTGFCTLFVGAYDSSTATLTYVNCGQEPALVRRASGQVEELAPTGPVLGSFTGAVFEEQMVRLEQGDALAIFTDGLTEVGPSRREMLGIEGIAEILTRSILPNEEVGQKEVVEKGITADRLAQRLISEVDAAAQGGVMRDDMCLLVCVAE